MKAGNYTVTLTVTSDAGEASATQIVNVGEYETNYVVIGVVVAIISCSVIGGIFIARRRRDALTG